MIGQTLHVLAEAAPVVHDVQGEPELPAEPFQVCVQAGRLPVGVGEDGAAANAIEARLWRRMKPPALTANPVTLGNIALMSLSCIDVSFPWALYPQPRSPLHLQTLGFSTPHMCPIIADGLQLIVFIYD